MRILEDSVFELNESKIVNPNPKIMTGRSFALVETGNAYKGLIGRVLSPV